MGYTPCRLQACVPFLLRQDPFPAFPDGFSMASEEFFDGFSKGQMDDSMDFVEWANDYQHYVATRREIEGHLQHAA